MQNFFEWFEISQINRDKTWLVLGKGPSFSQIDDYDINKFNLISLNHAVRNQRVLLAHMIDFDVPIDCAEHIYTNAQFLVMPWIPHINNVPTNKSLEELVQQTPALTKLYQENRILWYNLSTTDKVKGGTPIVPVAFFSAEAVINLLSIAGVSTIRSLGVDGGNTYSPAFDDIAQTKLLANGHQTFDLQFKYIAQTIMEKNIDYAPLNIESPIKVFVGSGEEQLIATKVLGYSIKKNTSMSVDIIPLYQSGITVPMPKDPANRPRTPFSFQRFFIPQLKNFKGRAIYMDSDMQVFTDVRNLWTRPFNGGDVLAAYETDGSSRRPQFSVMLMDCEALRWDINDIVAKLDSGELDYAKLMFEMKVAKNIKPELEREWNSLEFYDEGKTCLLHYTDMDKQPWLFRNNQLGHIWVRELVEALDKKFITIEEVKSHILRGNMRPSLLYQIKARHYEVRNLPANVKMLDKFFVPPHIKNQHTPKWKLLANRLIVKMAIAYYKL